LPERAFFDLFWGARFGEPTPVASGNARPLTPRAAGFFFLFFLRRSAVRVALLADVYVAFSRKKQAPRDCRLPLIPFFLLAWSPCGLYLQHRPSRIPFMVSGAMRGGDAVALTSCVNLILSPLGLNPFTSFSPCRPCRFHLPLKASSPPLPSLAEAFLRREGARSAPPQRPPMLPSFRRPFHPM